MISIKGERYISFRNSTLPDLYPHKIKEDKLDYNNIRFLVENHTIGGDTPAIQTYEFNVDSDKLFKALAGEIEVFFLKQHLQKVNLANSNNVDKTWLFVTNYYYAFYSATLLLRMKRTGFIFLSRSEANNLQNILTAVTGSLVQMPEGGYLFTSEEVSSNQSKVILKKDNGNTHSKTWIMFHDFLKEYLALSDAQNDEYTALKKIDHIFSIYQQTFLSTRRNALNYQGIQAAKSIKSDLFGNTKYCNEEFGQLFKDLMSLQITSNKKYVDEAAYFLAPIFAELSRNLYLDYREISGSKIFKGKYK
ncbi:hypothetical protein [Lewinella sp. JB7]|uniref:hypothetical protein n=1 Tax=Lewinella sp. JB7 TaxID=2962887 RepID=UPI0020C9A036|nr:hypothetical protein [Lewinella sp. JB7]MCP9237968.1 hypothetical protein [Lewinella sp. JB7]